ncbi:MAG: hypothetical protein WDO56_23270 [Gammaproteobacteria bacterium]
MSRPGCRARAGRRLAGPVLLDLSSNALTLEARGQLNGQILNLGDITLTQKNLTQARGQARVTFEEASPRVVLAHVDLADLEFPAAYTSYLQIGLASTDFGQLKTTGSARGSLDINDNAVTQLALYVSGLNMEDAKNKFSMTGVNADLHWAKDEKHAGDAFHRVVEQRVGLWPQWRCLAARVPHAWRRPSSSRSLRGCPCSTARWW